MTILDILVYTRIAEFFHSVKIEFLAILPHPESLPCSARISKINPTFL